MKRYIFCLLLVTATFVACKKDDQLVYDAKDNIYLNYKDKDGNQDTSALTYSFAYNPTLSKDTIWVPVIISGARVNRNRKFVINVVDSLTTAKADLHYEALKAFYIMPADSGKVRVPIIIKNTDPNLAGNTVSLGFRVAGGDEFESSLPLPLRTRTLKFSARLEQPSWWIFWQGQLGQYTRIKHQLFLISSGTIDLVDMSKPNAYLQIPRTLFYLDNAKNFVTDPFTWVSRNSSKGYVLTKSTDGSKDYEFYSSSSPEKKFTLKYYAAVDRYFFVDENGNQIIIN
jgi:hypothetical protein